MGVYAVNDLSSASLLYCRSEATTKTSTNWKHNRRGVLLEDSLPDRIVHAEAYTALVPTPMWVYINIVFIETLIRTTIN